MEPMKKLNPAVTAIIVIVLIAIAAAAVVALNNSQKAAAPVTSDSTSPSSNQSQAPSPTASQYKDGTYSATGSYSTPGGRESIELEVTLTGGTVQDTKLTQKGMTGEAKEYQARFASGYKTEVIGKSIDEVSLSRVAGSSLTSAGFNNALDQIKRDAAA
jgi:uncharacterized protein with FMN-binding domain